MNKNYLFVYGTLRKEYGLALLEEVADLIVYVGQGRVKAALYDLGNYPAAVKGDWQKEVRGDVYAIRDANAVFAVLDEYEGEEYQLEKIVVEVDTGEAVEAFIYWYTGETGKALLIEEGDYLDYLKNKKDRFI